jgi:hypothetical protein
MEEHWMLRERKKWAAAEKLLLRYTLQEQHKVTLTLKMQYVQACTLCQPYYSALLFRSNHWYPPAENCSIFCEKVQQYWYSLAYRNNNEAAQLFPVMRNCT